VSWSRSVAETIVAQRFSKSWSFNTRGRPNEVCVEDIGAVPGSRSRATRRTRYARLASATFGTRSKATQGHWVSHDPVGCSRGVSHARQLRASHRPPGAVGSGRRRFAFGLAASLPRNHGARPALPKPEVAGSPPSSAQRKAPEHRGFSLAASVSLAAELESGFNRCSAVSDLTRGGRGMYIGVGSVLALVLLILLLVWLF
jgi:hypothetical protein